MSAIPTGGFIDGSIATGGYLPHITPTPAVPSGGGMPYWKREEREGRKIAVRYIRINLGGTIYRTQHMPSVRINANIRRSAKIKLSCGLNIVRYTKIRTVLTAFTVTVRRSATFVIGAEIGTKRHILPSIIQTNIKRRQSMSLIVHARQYSSFEDAVIIACI